MKTKGKHRLVCTESGTWTVEQLVADMGHADSPRMIWTKIKTFKEKHQAGYDAATKWMEENL